MPKPVISVEHLTKRYDLSVIGTGTLSRDLKPLVMIETGESALLALVKLFKRMFVFIGRKTIKYLAILLGLEFTEPYLNLFNFLISGDK